MQDALRMKSLRAVVALAGLAAVPVGCGSLEVAKAPEHLATQASCPKYVLYRASSLAPVAEALRAAQRSLARRTLMAQGVTYHLTPRNAPIVLIAHALAWEGRGNVIFNRFVPGALTILRAGEAQCGRRVAEASWTIHYGLPVASVANTGVYRFFVKTRRGWRFWGDWCGAGQAPTWRRKNCIF
jgi:hypothetical protein